MGKESVRSGGSRTSKVSRNTNGRFEGSTKFGENTFIMKGFTKGKQQWKCLSCEKKTVGPSEHVC